MRDLLRPDLPPVLHRKVARALMHSSPPLISPIQYSEKSLRKNTLYDSPREIYTIVEATLDEGYATSVYTLAALCYSPACAPGHGGCYSPCCPNRLPAKPALLSDKVSDVQKLKIGKLRVVFAVVQRAPQHVACILVPRLVP